MNSRTKHQTIQNSWQQRWLALLSQLNVPTGPGQLREQIQACRVRQIELMPGRIAADVSHQTLGSCAISIEIPVLSQDEWTSALDALASQTVISTQLLAGEMPMEIEKLFVQSGARLTPTMADELHVACSCCTSNQPFCQPALAAYVAVGEMLVDDPWLLFRLRGRDRQQIAAALNERRTQSGEEKLRRDPSTNQSLVYRAGGTSAHLEETPRLDEEIDHYWGQSRQQLEFQHHITAPHIELVLLRRLGPPTHADNSIDVYENLTQVYRRVTDASMALAYSPEDLDVNDAE